MFAERAESSRNEETLPPNAFARFLTFIRFSHTVFALPFALGALFVAADGWPASRTLVLVILCMTCARTAAMLFNRLVDWSLDQRNPRTKSRHRLIPKTVTWLLLGFSSVAFVIAAAAINHATFLLSPIALAIIFLYSVTKRFTDTTHFFLGLALAVGPAGAWIAQTGRLDLPPIVLGGSGNGEAMVANKVRGVRCALCWNEETAQLSRKHNDANVLSIGERMISEELALQIVRIWLTTDFEGGRHVNRIAQLEPD